MPPRPSAPQPVLPSCQAWPLHDAAASRAIEAAALAAHAPQALMARAGLAVARLALAVAPQARRAWVACGPGNNGGDGLVAARHLHAAGWQVQVNRVLPDAPPPPDAAWALREAQQAGVPIRDGLADMPPPQPGAAPLLAIDALLGLGSRRAPAGPVAEALRWLHASRLPVLAVDLPTGLDGDTGALLAGREDAPSAPGAPGVAGPPRAVRARHTLALLTLKPGLFTAEGRDHAGQVWLDDLGVDATGLAPATAWLSGPETLHQQRTPRQHAAHKGRYGDLLVLGGSPGMAGAALLAARAGLAAGAGRTLLCRLDGVQGPDVLRPELMPRTPAEALQPAMLARSTVVCGCGGGQAVQAMLGPVLAHAARLVLDADALNAVAADPGLQAALQARAGADLPTVLTPHPLEAARLLATSTAAVQANRLAMAQALAERCRAVVVLKGSGSVVAAPGLLPWLNPTGSARLGTGGSGDVLAGWLGGWLAGQQAPITDSGLQQLAAAAVWLHGRAADAGDPRLPLRAGDLIDAMGAAMPGPG